MEPQTQQESKAKDFFINLGATVSLYTVVFSLINLLFTVINYAYPRISNNYYYYNYGESIALPVSVLIIFFPIFLILMWIMSREYSARPEKKNAGIHKWLTYLTLFLAGGLLAGDLITIIYYFLAGNELTIGFILKVLVLLIVSGSIFTYYLSEIRGRLTQKSRLGWRVFATVIVVVSIVWGFVVLGSPFTQRLYRYDSEKVNDLSSIRNSVESYYSINGELPSSLDEVLSKNYGYVPKTDPQTGEAYEYTKVGAVEYKLCAVFNKPSNEKMEQSQAFMYGISWSHPEGHYCFEQKINPNLYSKPVSAR